jgi:predicted PurR-regulated permease PerM
MKKALALLFLGFILTVNSSFIPVENNSFVQTELKARQYLSEQAESVLKTIDTGKEELSKIVSDGENIQDETKNRSKSISQLLGEWVVGFVRIAVTACLDFVMSLFR